MSSRPFFASFLAARRGVASVEYAVILGTLAAVIVAAFSGLLVKMVAVMAGLAI